LPPWLLAATVALAAFGFSVWRSRRAQHHETRAHGFAAIRVLYPDELKPFFGVYLPERADLMGYAFIAVFVSVVGVFIFAVTVPVWATTLIAITIATAASAAAYAESRSKRVIGPDVIAYVSVFRRLSWSLPLLEVTRCEVVPGSPTPRLRVYTRHGSRLLPLTNELWRALSAGYA
jgi:hypothetical protein